MRPLKPVRSSIEFLSIRPAPGTLAGDGEERARYVNVTVPSAAVDGGETACRVHLLSPD